MHTTKSAIAELSKSKLMSEFIFYFFSSKNFLWRKSLKDKSKHNIWIFFFVTEQWYETILMCFILRINKTDIRTHSGYKKLKRKLEYLRLLCTSILRCRKHSNFKFWKSLFMNFSVANCYNEKKYYYFLCWPIFKLLKCLMVLHFPKFK